MIDDDVTPRVKFIRVKLQRGKSEGTGNDKRNG